MKKLSAPQRNVLFELAHSGSVETETKVLPGRIRITVTLTDGVGRASKMAVSTFRGLLDQGYIEGRGDCFGHQWYQITALGRAALARALES